MLKKNLRCKGKERDEKVDFADFCVMKKIFIILLILQWIKVGFYNLFWGVKYEILAFYYRLNNCR